MCVCILRHMMCVWLCLWMTCGQSSAQLLFFSLATVRSMLDEQVYSYEEAERLLSHKPVVPLEDAVLDMQRYPDPPLITLRKQSLPN